MSIRGPLSPGARGAAFSPPQFVPQVYLTETAALTLRHTLFATSRYVVPVQAATLHMTLAAEPTVIRVAPAAFTVHHTVSAVGTRVAVASATFTLHATLASTPKQTFVQAAALPFRQLLSAPGINLNQPNPGTIPHTDTWVVNLETRASSQYDSYGFNSFAAVDGVGTLACADDGIYLLSGTDDAGTAINASVQLPKQNFGSPRAKQVPNVWVGVKSTLQMQLKADLDSNSFTYQARTMTPTDLHMHRFDLGRGLWSNYWTFTLLSSGAFELEGIEFQPITRQRRL